MDCGLGEGGKRLAEFQAMENFLQERLSIHYLQTAVTSHFHLSSLYVFHNQQALNEIFPIAGKVSLSLSVERYCPRKGKGDFRIFKENGKKIKSRISIRRSS